MGSPLYNDNSLSGWNSADWLKETPPHAPKCEEATRLFDWLINTLENLPPNQRKATAYEIEGKLRNRYLPAINVDQFSEAERVALEEKVNKLQNVILSCKTVKSSMDHVVAAAARKGGVLQEFKKTPKVTPLRRATSSQEVWIGSSLVFKKTTPRAKEEESIIDSLFDLVATKSALLPSITVSDSTAKPYQHMVQACYIDDAFRNYIENRLNATSEYSALLTAEFQFLDLHSLNMGFAPAVTDNVKHYETKTFSYTEVDGRVRQQVSLDVLMKDYLQSRILSNETSIQVSSLEETGTLNSLPNLKAVVKADRWNLVLFDSDLSLGEDNNLSFQSNGNYLIPIRNTLLESASWKDKPFGKATLAKIAQLDEREGALHAWINREDSPTRMRLTKEAKREIDSYIAHFYHNHKWTLSALRQQTTDPVTVDTLNTFIATDLASDMKHDSFWKSLGNPKNRIETAKSLLPRLSWRQRYALIEREERRKFLIENNRKLREPGDKRALLELILSSEITPFTTTQKNDFIERLGSSDVEALVKDVKAAYEITFFNICKMMYPLLADFFYLNEVYHAFKTEHGINSKEVQRLAGSSVGNHQCSLIGLINWFREGKNATYAAAHLDPSLNQITVWNNILDTVEALDDCIDSDRANATFLI